MKDSFTYLGSSLHAPAPTPAVTPIPIPIPIPIAIAIPIKELLSFRPTR